MSVLNMSSKKRMDMIQNGYNPLDAEDVDRFDNNQKPIGEIQEHVAKVKRENLGNKNQSDRRDFAALGRQDEGGAALDNRQYGNPKEQLNYAMDDYEYDGGGDIRERIGSKLPNQYPPADNYDQQPDYRQPQNQYQQPRNGVVSSYADDPWADEQYGPVDNQRPPQQQFNESNRPQKGYLIMEAKSAVNYGYNNSKDYLTAFIKLMQAPAASRGRAREDFVEAVNKMARMEPRVHPSLLKYYRGGVAKAEKQVYEQLNKGALNG